jgi:TRAP-type mannitol/chloroaromatic compound transport system substrate-binding protein
MKRRDFLKVTGIGAASTAIAAPAIAQSMPELKWRMTVSWPKALDTIYGGADQMCKAIAEATDNKFQVQLFAAGEIVPGLQVLDAVQNGTVEMGHTSSYYYFGKDPTFAFGTAVPFGLNARMQNAWMYHGGGMELMNAFYKKFNFIGFPAGNTGAQMGGWFRKEIKDAADMRGLKMRIGGFAGTVIAKLGVVPQQIPGSDIYTALERGSIDAAEWVGPYDDARLGFQKVAPYYYYPGWWEGGPMIHNFINLDKWNSLSPAYRSLIRTASSLANEWMVAKYDAVNPPALKKMLAEGVVQFRQFPASVMDASLKAALEIYGEVSARNPDFKKVWEHVLAFRNDAYLWWRVAEYTYDDFLIRNKAKT